MDLRILQGTTGPYQEEIEKLRMAFDQADAVIVGAGAGLSTSAGLEFGGPRFARFFPDHAPKYGITDMYSGCFASFDNEEDYWGFMSRVAWVNRFMNIPRPTLSKLKDLLEQKKDYFVLTTNVDHSFRRAGFPKERTCYTQGDFGLFQCSKPCHQETYDNDEVIYKMVEAQGFVPNAEGLLDVPEGGPTTTGVPSELIPHCPRCGGPMELSLFWDHRFVRDEGWHLAHDRYEQYLAAHQSGKILYLELGVGYNSPGVIKYPFWQRVWQNEEAVFASVNLDAPSVLDVILDRSIVISADIDKVLTDLMDRGC